MKALIKGKTRKLWFFAENEEGHWDLACSETFEPQIGMAVPDPESNGLLEKYGPWLVRVVVRDKKVGLLLSALEKLDSIYHHVPGAVHGEVLPAITKLVQTCIRAERGAHGSMQLVRVRMEFTARLTSGQSGLPILQPAKRAFAVVSRKMIAKGGSNE